MLIYQTGYYRQVIKTVLRRKAITVGRKVTSWGSFRDKSEVATFLLFFSDSITFLLFFGLSDLIGIVKLIIVFAISQLSLSRQTPVPMRTSFTSPYSERFSLVHIVPVVDRNRRCSAHVLACPQFEQMFPDIETLTLSE
jgi:hypothetical protein